MPSIGVRSLAFISCSGMVVPPITAAIRITDQSTADAAASRPTGGSFSTTAVTAMKCPRP